MPKVTCILNEAILAQVDARADVGEKGRGLGRSTVIEDACERYFLLMAFARAEMQERFTGAELSLIADASNGTMVEAWSLRYFAEGVKDAIEMDGLADKWDVDAELILRKMRDLSLTQTAALVDAVERFWKNPTGDAADLLKNQPGAA